MFSLIAGKTKSKQIQGEASALFSYRKCGYVPNTYVWERLKFKMTKKQNKKENRKDLRRK